VGAHPGYFDLRDRRPVAKINTARPDILWVGMGDPRQVLWAAAWQPHLKARLLMTCGGMFKIVAGELARLSPWWRQHGFEWAYRLWQEPATWRRYLLGLPLFGFRVLAQCLRGEARLPAYGGEPSAG
jgi:N-acetylglucosaminyldiphosphoundecaprenol N-acetyl-beta-D-mannosaminyltransferase